jgi:hypothetical protein
MELAGIFGRSTNVTNSLEDVKVITGIEVNEHQNCGVIEIDGTNFHVQCGCSGRCTVNGWWSIHTKS